MQQSFHTNTSADTTHTRGKTSNPIIVFLILAAFTIVEIGITVLGGAPKSASVPLLLSISFVKASLVALYFMHLRYEKAMYGLVFIIPAAFAVFLIAVLLLG